MRTMFGLALGLSGLLLGVVGCGGSGDPPPGAATPSVALLSGAYRYFALRGESGPPELGEVRWGTGDADGVGGMTVAFSSNSEGTLGSVGPQPLTYTVDPDRALEWQIAGFAGARGRLSADGRLAALATTGAGATPSVQLLVRREGAFGAASLGGAYHVLGFSRSVSGFVPACASLWGTLTFDGVGTSLLSVTGNQDGVVSTPAPMPGTYAVTADGTATLTVGTWSWTGGVLLGSDLVVLAGSTGAGQDPWLMLCVRRSAAASASSLSGSFRLLGFFRSPAVGSYGSLTGDVVVDGGGALSGSVTENVEGTVTAGLPFTATLSVAPDGTLTGSAFGTGLSGGLAPDGRFAALGGGTGAGADPVLLVLLR